MLEKDNMLEIERKFLVNDEWKPSGKGKAIKQGYLSVDPERVVRVRIADNEAFLTVKGKSAGIVRTELEYKIPQQDAEILLTMCLDFPVSKKRYTEKIGNKTWEIDVFEGDNKGLVLAEIELKNENEEFQIPDWAFKEVSYDKRFFNSWLSKNPFLNWESES